MVPLSQGTDYYVASTIPWSQANVHTDKTESQGHLHKDYSYLNHTKIIWGLLLYVNPPIPRKHTKKIARDVWCHFHQSYIPFGVL